MMSDDFEEPAQLSGSSPSKSQDPSRMDFDDFEEPSPVSRSSPSKAEEIARMIAEADTSNEAALYDADLSIYAHMNSSSGGVFMDGIQAESPDEVQALDTQAAEVVQRVEDIDFSAAAEESSPAGGTYSEDEGDGTYDDGVFELENAETVENTEGEFEKEVSPAAASQDAPDDYEDDFSSDAGESAGEEQTAPVAVSATARALSSTYASLRPNTGTDYGDDFIEDDDDLG